MSVLPSLEHFVKYHTDCQRTCSYLQAHDRVNNSISAIVDQSGRKMDCQLIMRLSHWTVNWHGKSIDGWAEMHNISCTSIYQQLLDPHHVNHVVGGGAGL